MPNSDICIAILEHELLGECAVIGRRDHIIQFPDIIAIIDRNSSVDLCCGYRSIDGIVTDPIGQVIGIARLVRCGAGPDSCAVQTETRQESSWPYKNHLSPDYTRALNIKYWLNPINLHRDGTVSTGLLIHRQVVNKLPLVPYTCVYKTDGLTCMCAIDGSVVGVNFTRGKIVEYELPITLARDDFVVYSSKCGDYRVWVTNMSMVHVVKDHSQHKCTTHQLDISSPDECKSTSRGVIVRSGRQAVLVDVRSKIAYYVDGVVAIGGINTRYASPDQVECVDGVKAIMKDVELQTDRKAKTAQ